MLTTLRNGLRKVAASMADAAAAPAARRRGRECSNDDDDDDYGSDEEERECLRHQGTSRRRPRIHNSDSIRALDLLPDCYRVRERVASGTHSTVWRAVNTDTEATVAVKAMSLAVPHEAVAVRRRRIRHADREDAVWTHVCDEHLLPRYASYARGCLRATVMQYCNGGDLFSHMERCRRRSGSPRLASVGDTLRVARSLLRALRHLHDVMHVVHRDVKPENIFLHFDDTEVGDVGGGDTNDDDASALRRARIVLGDFTFIAPCNASSALDDTVGTPKYMAPEIWRRERYGTAVDCWSAGVTVYQCFEGRHPFVGRDAADDARASHTDVRGALRRNAMRTMLQVDSPSSVDVVRGLLRKQPAVRLTAAQALEAKQWL